MESFHQEAVKSTATKLRLNAGKPSTEWFSLLFLLSGMVILSIFSLGLALASQPITTTALGLRRRKLNPSARLRFPSAARSPVA